MTHLLGVVTEEELAVRMIRLFGVKAKFSQSAQACLCPRHVPSCA